MGEEIWILIWWNLETQVDLHEANKKLQAGGGKPGVDTSQERKQLDDQRRQLEEHRKQVEERARGAESRLKAVEEKERMLQGLDQELKKRKAKMDQLEQQLQRVKIYWKTITLTLNWIFRFNH